METAAGASSNQPPPFADIDLFSTDVALQQAIARCGVDAQASALATFGSAWGSAESFELGALANRHTPILHVLDARGERADRVEFHPSWHALMTRSMAAGLHNSTWEGDSHSARAARIFMAYQVESGHICPLTMTHASLAALNADPVQAEPWRTRILSRSYDPSLRPWWEKRTVTLGMGMTERQGGTDLRANITSATQTGDHYEITGHKWFMSAPMCDGFLVLAQAGTGPTCFLMPRHRPDGALNGVQFQRLKDKLGNRSNASSEVQFEAAYAQRIGEEGRGIRTMIDMVQLTRLDCAIASAGLMRFGLASAVHHARHRRVFGQLLIRQPAMRALLADLALEVEAMTALVFRLARACDAAPGNEAEAAIARLLTPAIKYLVCKRAPDFLYECMECLGGNGYVEDFPLARAYREAPVNAIWEGSGNVVALDVLRAARSAPEAAGAIVCTLEQQIGTGTPLFALMKSETAERQARAIAERMASLAALMALREGTPDFADAWAATRIHGAPRATWGACDLSAFEDALLARVLPD
jgi:putative acyl-CoA dehydrogenase